MGDFVSFQHLAGHIPHLVIVVPGDCSLLPTAAAQQENQGNQACGKPAHAQCAGGASGLAGAATGAPAAGATAGFTSRLPAIWVSRGFEKR